MISRKVNKSYRGCAAPIVVHSTDGTGRTGSYILLDMVLNRVARGIVTFIWHAFSIKALDSVQFTRRSFSAIFLPNFFKNKLLSTYYWS